MDDLQDYLLLGEIYREHGVDGRVKVYLYSGSSQNFMVGSPVLLKNAAGKILQAKIQEVQPMQGRFLTKFDVFVTREEAQVWRKAHILVLKKNLANTCPHEAYLFEFMDGLVKDTKGCVLGSIVGFAGGGSPIYLKVKTQDKEVLIPLVESWIRDLNKVTKEIVLDLPEGLLDVS